MIQVASSMKVVKINRQISESVKHYEPTKISLPPQGELIFYEIIIELKVRI
jgi:hypothetical protein